MYSPLYFACVNPSLGLVFWTIEVFDENHFVARFVVEQFVRARFDHQQAEPARAQPSVFSDAHVRDGVVGIVDRGVVERVDVKAGSGIFDAKHEHALKSEKRDSDLFARIELPAPFNGIGEELVK